MGEGRMNVAQKQELVQGKKTELYFGKKLEMPAIMYGFGDVCRPRLDSALLLEAYVIEFIVDLVEKCSAVAQEKKRERPDVSDLKFVIRRDKKKLHRVQYLLHMKHVIDRSRFAIDRRSLPFK
eukprot:jgi/Galph1/824/GphlegSOOS_G5545.1